MAFVSPRMSLSIWNAPGDPYDHEQLADNFLKLDQHDHTMGKGAPIGSSAISAGAIQSSHFAAGLDPAPAFTSYKPIRWAHGSLVSTSAAATYGIETGQNIVTATGGPNLAFYMDFTDFGVVNRTTKIRLRVSHHNTTAQTSNFTFALTPVTIAAGTVTLLANTVSVAINAPSAGMTTAVSSEVTAPAAGLFMVTCLTTATIATNGSTLKAVMQMRQV